MKNFFALLLSFFILISFTGCTKTETTTIPAKLIIEWEEYIEEKIDWTKNGLPNTNPIAPEILQQLKSIGDFKISTKIMIENHESKQIHTIEFLREIRSNEVMDLMPKFIPVIKNKKYKIIHKGAVVTTKKTTFMGMYEQVNTVKGPVFQVN